jgi:hypothetical protein
MTFIPGQYRTQPVLRITNGRRPTSSWTRRWAFQLRFLEICVPCQPRCSSAGNSKMFIGVTNSTRLKPTPVRGALHFVSWEEIEWCEEGIRPASSSTLSLEAFVRMEAWPETNCTSCAFSSCGSVAVYLLFCMGVELGLRHQGKNIYIEGVENIRAQEDRSGGTH